MKDSIETKISKVRAFFSTNRRLPTYQELADLFHFSSRNAAFKLAQRLIEAGYLEKDSSGKLIPKNLFAPLPSTGFVQAGFPTSAYEVVGDIVSLDQYLITHPESTFMLTVSGESMIEEGIKPGDTVLVERGKTIRNGDIVVANVDGEWTMKYYFKKGSDVTLKPANKLFSDIIPKESLEIAGVVVATVRKYQ
ncbi:MAG: transcriptional repressor LexA [Candidatus Roizmanbacteria bacterium]